MHSLMFRTGMSHLAMGNLDLALFDLTSALAIDPLDCTSLTMRAGVSRFDFENYYFILSFGNFVFIYIN